MTFHPRGLRPYSTNWEVALRKDDLGLRFFTTITTVGTPRDITLQELRVECFFPADEPTDTIVRRIAGGDGVQVSGRYTCPSS